MVHYDPYPFPPHPEPLAKSKAPAPTYIHPTTVEEALFEREKDAVLCYEQGWDRWDGPVWPLGYVQCRMRRYFLLSAGEYGLTDRVQRKMGIVVR